MAAGKYIVTKELHIRKAAPRLLRDNVAGVLYPNFVIDAVDEVAGDSYSDQYINSDIWLKDGNGFYYWKGGIQGFDGLGPAGTKTINYNTLINIPEHIKETKGKGVVIAIVDTGCKNHPAIKNAIIEGHNLVSNSTTLWEDTSIYGHGTKVAWVIAAKGGAAEVTGVAPEAKILVVRGAEKEDQWRAETLLEALEWLIKESRPNYIKPDIINLSFDLDPGNLDSKLKDIISTIRRRGILIFASAQNDSALFKADFFYPARLDEVLGVGALTPDKFPPGNLNLDTKVRYVVPNIDLLPNLNIGYKRIESKGCSFSTALLSGVAALYISYCRIAALTITPLEAMGRDLMNFNPAIFDNALKIYKNETPAV